MLRRDWRDVLVGDTGISPPVYKARRRDWDRIRHRLSHAKDNRRQYFRSLVCGLIQSPRPETLARHNILRLESGEYVLGEPLESHEEPKQLVQSETISVAISVASQGMRSVSR